METKKSISMLEDRKVNVKIKLALLWVALMFLYIYNDIFSMFQPGHVAELVEGQLGGIKFTQTLLFSAAVLMALVLCGIWAYGVIAGIALVIQHGLSFDSPFGALVDALVFLLVLLFAVWFTVTVWSNKEQFK